MELTTKLFDVGKASRMEHTPRMLPNQLLRLVYVQMTSNYHRYMER